MAVFKDLKPDLSRQRVSFSVVGSSQQTEIPGLPVALAHRCWVHPVPVCMAAAWQPCLARCLLIIARHADILLLF